jgi:hypothetical protein
MTTDLYRTKLPDLRNNRGSWNLDPTQSFEGLLPPERRAIYMDEKATDEPRVNSGEPTVCLHQQYHSFPAMITLTGRQLIAADPIYDFLVSLTHLVTLGEEDTAIKLILSYCNFFLSQGMFSVCDSVLRKASLLVPCMGPGLIVSFLLITSKAKDRLPSRGQFLSTADWFLMQTQGANETNRLLKGFKC